MKNIPKKQFVGWMLMLLLCISSSAFAQSPKKVTGRVMDAQGELLIGVNVTEAADPSNGVVTDINGTYTITLKSNKPSLRFSYIGFKDKVVAVGSKGVLDVALEEDVAALDEVVVVGFGTQKKASVVGSITNIEPAKLAAAPSRSLSNNLAGMVPGVIAVQRSGDPWFNNSDFWIRGISTFGASSAALVLIDGIEGRLEDIEPDDVKSFSILKDASATAVYGTRGANGVVLVTTKRGETGKLTITGRATLKVSHIKRLPEYLGAYDYALLANEARAMSGEDDLYSRLELDLIKYNLDKDLYPDVNWIDEIMKRTSIQQNYYINAQGGGDIARYYLSLGYQDEGAAYRQEDNLFKKPLSYKKITYRANIDMNLTKTTKVYLGLDGYISNYTSPGGQNTNTVWSAVRQLTPLMFPKTYSDGTFPSYGKHDLASPYVMLNNTGYTQDETQRNMLTLKLEQ